MTTTTPEPQQFLWAKGKVKDYDAFVIEVHIKKDRATGRITSHKRLQDSVDENVVHTLPSGGLEEGAWALLQEAVRGEATLQLLVKLTSDPELQAFLQNAGSSLAESDLCRRLSSNVREQLERELQELVPALVRETLETVGHGLRSQTESTGPVTE